MASTSNPSIPLLDGRGFIAGEWQKASNDATFDVYEPSSGEVLAKVANFGHTDFVNAIDAAYEGYREFYNGTTAKERGEILLRWYEAIEKNQEDCKFTNPDCLIRRNPPPPPPSPPYNCRPLD